MTIKNAGIKSEEAFENLAFLGYLKNSSDHEGEIVTCNGKW